VRNAIFASAIVLGIQSVSYAQVVRELVGKYQMEVPGGDTLELRADGSASLAGEETRWSVRGNQLSVGPDVMPYVLQGNRLMTTVGAIQLAWRRVGSSRGNQTPMERAALAAGSQGNVGQANSQDTQARQILTGTAWCSFTYNKVSGTSTKRKVVFRPDGVMTINGGAETYSSGYGGTYAGQSSNASAMLWKFENLRLLVDDRSGAGYQDIGLTSTTNSNGSIILKAQGREYAMCQ
jgi:hypothetical protein